MTEKDSLHGLSCPNCGGMVPIPEGQAIVFCSFCEQRSFVRGERGLRRYQVPQRIDREQAEAAWRKLLKGSLDIDDAAIEGSQLTETFVVHLPFWAVWARLQGLAFGEEYLGDKNYDPVEIKIAQDVHWNQVACAVGEFGVVSLALTDQSLEPFNPAELHASGMVFEPLGSPSEAKASAEKEFEAIVHQKVRSDLDRVGQVLTLLTERRQGLVYYPLWVLRYLYRGRAFQMVVDGYSGEVLYGKAPGSTNFRAFELVSGMLFGAFMGVDLAAGAFLLGIELGDLFIIVGLLAALGLVSAGFGLMFSTYRKFRYGEIFEYFAPRDEP